MMTFVLIGSKTKERAEKKGENEGGGRGGGGGEGGGGGVGSCWSELTKNFIRTDAYIYI